eukprot:109614-Chlamydomonas_euryale.AAC.3
MQTARMQAAAAGRAAGASLRGCAPRLPARVVTGAPLTRVRAQSGEPRDAAAAAKAGWGRRQV